MRIPNRNYVYICSNQTKFIMASISDIILQQVKASAGNVSIPSNIKDKVMGGLSD